MNKFQKCAEQLQEGPRKWKYMQWMTYGDKDFFDSPKFIHESFWEIDLLQRRMKIHRKISRIQHM